MAASVLLTLLSIVACTLLCCAAAVDTASICSGPEDTCHSLLVKRHDVASMNADLTEDKDASHASENEETRTPNLNVPVTDMSQCSAILNLTSLAVTVHARQAGEWCAFKQPAANGGSGASGVTVKESRTEGECGCAFLTWYSDSKSYACYWDATTSSCKMGGALMLPPPSVLNGGFENGSTTSSYQYQEAAGGLPGWNTTGGTGWHQVFIRSGNGAFHGTTTTEGDYFLGLLLKDTAIAQSLSGHQVGRAYTLHFSAASHLGRSTALLIVKVQGEVLKSFAPANRTFTQYSVPYTAASETVDIEFENGSPRGDNRVFIDDIYVA